MSKRILLDALIEMYDQKNKQALKCTKRVTLLAMVANIALVVVKVVVGSLFCSVALIADGAHSLSDMFVDFSVLLGSFLGTREPDESHPYGHGRAETFAAMFISIFMFLVGSAMLYYAAVRIAKHQVICASYAVLAAAAASVIVKEILYRVTKTAAVKHDSTVLYANAWHHRSDALSSVAVLIGFLAMKLGYSYGDQLAAIAVGLMIIIIAIRILGKCFHELGERSVDKETIEHIKNIINANKQIRHWHKLRTRTIAREIFLDLHILVDTDLNITQAHDIAEHLENTLHEQLSRPVNIMVHIEPDLPELRKANPQK